MAGIWDMIMGGQQMQQPQEQGLAQQILSSRFQPDQPTMNDVANSALASVSSGKYEDPQQYSDARMASGMKQMALINEMQQMPIKQALMMAQIKKATQPDLPTGYVMGADGIAKLAPGVDPSFGKRADPYGMPIPVFNPQSNQMEYAPKGSVATGGYMPPPPHGFKYGQGNSLIPSEPSARDQMRIAKSNEAAGAATNVENLANEALGILKRYDTGKLSKIRGEAGAWYDVMSDQPSPQEIEDYQAISRISKSLGAQALQQFGGNDTDKELQIAIQSNIDPTGLTASNVNSAKRALLAAKILRDRPIFEEEWLQRANSLTAPDASGATFSRKWMEYQRDAWKKGLAELQGGEVDKTGIKTKGAPIKFLGFEGEE